jgi:hypothetical protein
MIETKWKDWKVAKLANNFTKYANQHLQDKKETDSGITKYKYKFDVKTPNIIRFYRYKTFMEYIYSDDKSKVIGKKYYIFNVYAKKRHLRKTNIKYPEMLGNIFLKDKIIIYKDVGDTKKAMQYVIKKLEFKSGVNWRLIKRDD